MTMGTSRSSGPTSRSAPWTIRLAVRQSEPTAIAIGVAAALAAFATTWAADIPVAAGLTLVALIPAVLVDVIERRLPNRMLAAATGFGLLTLTVEWVISRGGVKLTDPLLGALAMAAPLLCLHMAAPVAIGFGDVKLALVAGAAVGLVDPIAGLVALAIGSAGAATVGLARRLRTVAFGPGLLGGAIVALLLVATPLDPIARRAGQQDIDVSRHESLGAAR